MACLSKGRIVPERALPSCLTVAVATKDPSIIDQETIVTLKMTTVDPENQDEIETLNENLEDVTRKIIKEVPTKVTKIVIMKDLKMEKEMNK